MMPCQLGHKLKLIDNALNPKRIRKKSIDVHDITAHLGSPVPYLASQ